MDFVRENYLTQGVTFEEKRFKNRPNMRITVHLHLQRSYLPLVVFTYHILFDILGIMDSTPSGILLCSNLSSIQSFHHAGIFEEAFSKQVHESIHDYCVIAELRHYQDFCKLFLRTNMNILKNMLQRTVKVSGCFKNSTSIVFQQSQNKVSFQRKGSSIV